jgi:WD40 repeat protein
MHAGYPSQAGMAGRKQGNAKLWIGLAVAALLVVAVAAIAAVLILPRLLNPEASNANTNTANANANANTGRETSGGPKTLADAGTLNAPSTVLRVAFSADGKYVASSADETTIRLWNASDHSLVRELTGQGAPSRGLDVSPDGVFVAAGADNGMLRIWKVVDGTEVSSFKAHDTPIFLLVYSTDGSKIVTAATDRTVKVWRASDGVSTKTVTPPSPDDSIIDVSPNLAYVAFYGADKGVTVVSLDANRPVATLSGHNYDLRAGAFSPDGELLALGSTDGSVRLWDATSGKMVRELKAGNAVSRLRFSSDGKLLASGSADGSVRLWNPGDGSKLFEATAHTKTVNGIAFSADGRSLATGSADKTIRLWSVVDKKQ